MAHQNPVRAFLQGNVEKKWLLTRILPLIIAIIGISLFISGIIFPTVFDWRYMVISDLMCPTANPQGFLYASIGVAICGVLAIPLVGYLHRRLRVICRVTTGVGTFFLILGIVGMMLVGIIYDAPGLPERLHVYLAAVAFLGLVFSFFFYGWPMIKDRMARYHGKRQFNGRLMAMSFTMLWFAFLGTAGSALYTELFLYNLFLLILTNLFLLISMVPEKVEALSK